MKRQFTSLSILALICFIAALNCHKPISLNASNLFQKNIAADSSALFKHVECLSSLQPARNINNLESLNKGALYIEQQFRLHSNRVGIQEYQVREGTVKNVIVSYGPENAPRIIVGAHYDVAGDQPGADDNASGVAGLLELSRLLSIDSLNLKRRIDLVAYTLEEPPYFATEQMGSYIHAKSLKEQKVEIVLMIALEMIGYFSDEPGSQSYPISAMKLFYPRKGNYIAVISNSTTHITSVHFVDRFREKCKIPVERLTAPAFIAGIDYSDHRSYWHFGYQAIMITDTSFLRNRRYHQTTDTPETLDYGKMSEVIDGVYYAIVH